MANRTVNIYRRQKAHFELDTAFSLAGFARAALSIETKAPRPVPALKSRRCCRKHFSQRQHEPRIGCRIGSRRLTNCALVDLNDLVEIIGAFDFLEIKRLKLGAMQTLFHKAAERFVDKC